MINEIKYKILHLNQIRPSLHQHSRSGKTSLVKEPYSNSNNVPRQIDKENRMSGIMYVKKIFCGKTSRSRLTLPSQTAQHESISDRSILISHDMLTRHGPLTLHVSLRSAIFSDPEKWICDGPCGVAFSSMSGTCRPLPANFLVAKQSTCVSVRNMQIVCQCGVRMQCAVGKGGSGLLYEYFFLFCKSSAKIHVEALTRIRVRSWQG